MSGRGLCSGQGVGLYAAGSCKAPPLRVGRSPAGPTGPSRQHEAYHVCERGLFSVLWITEVLAGFCT
jgi:hypothetical protein